MEKNPSKYAVLYNKLKADILSHKYLPGSVLPSEQELIVKYDVSRTTVRRAISVLKEEGLVDVHQGRPTRISSVSLFDIGKDFISVKSDLCISNHFTLDEPHSVTTQGAVIDVIPAPAPAAKALGLSGDASVYRLQRMKMVNEQVYSFDTSYVPKSAAPGLDQYSGQIHFLYRFLKEQYQIEYEDGEELISAKNANFVESRLLNISPGAALLVSRRTAICRGAAFEYAESIKRADLLEIVIKSRASTPNAYYSEE